MVKRERLEELMRQRVAGRVLKAATLDTQHGASLADVLAAITGSLRDVPPTGDHAWTEKDLAIIAADIGRRFPVIAASSKTPSGSSPRRPASQQHRAEPNRAAAALAFPPLQSYSPRARTQGLAAANTARAVKPMQQQFVPRPPGSALSARGGDTGSGVSTTLIHQEHHREGSKLPQVNAPFAPDPVPPTPDTSRNGRPKILNAATLGAAGGDGFTDDDSPHAGGSSQLRRRPPPDMWSSMALADQQKWVAEQADRQRRDRETCDQHRALLRQQVQEKRTVAERERADEAKKQRAVEAYLQAQATKRQQDDSKRKAQESKVKDEIARQLEATAARKEKQRMRELLAEKKQKALYDQQLEEDKANLAARRQAAYEVQQQSLEYNAAQKAAKEAEKVAEAQRDRVSAKLMEEQLAIADARRKEHLAKVQSQGLRSQRMAATLQASFEHQQREQEDRAEREAAALREQAAAKAAQEMQRKLDSIGQTQRELLAQMDDQRKARERELRHEREMAEQLRRDDEEARSQAKALQLKKREIAAAHRQAVESQIAEKERRFQQPGDLTQTERSMNRQLLREAPALTPARA